MAIDVTSLYNRRADNRWDRTSVGDVLERVAAVRPDATAFVAGPGAHGDPAFARITYGAADEWANRFANALLSGGLQRADRVLMICGNSVDAFVAKIGVAKAGGVVVPINPSQVADFVEHAVRLTEPMLIIADTEYANLAAAVGRKVDVHVPIGDGPADGPSMREFCEVASPAPPEVTIHGDDIWEILFTSGTTAMPKGVMLSHAYAYLTALGATATHSRGVRHESLLRSVCFAPVMFHIGDQGYVMPTLFCGGTVLLGRAHNPKQAAALIAAEKATLAITGNRYLTGQLLAELEALEPGAASSLTCVLHATGILTPDELARFEALAPGVSVTYQAGQTECVASHRFPYDAFPERYADALDRHLNLIGQPPPLLASACVDVEDGVTPVPHDTIGELVYRSPVMTAGYYRDHEATERAFAHGWFHTGDLGTTEPPGERTITGRLKDVIKTGGENVASMRVESVVLLHPGIDQVAVIGLPDERWGEIVTAVVIPKPDATVDERELIGFCRERLPGFETPKRVIVVDKFPLGLGGKVLKHELRAQFLAVS